MRGDLSAAIDALRRPERRRGMAVIISDFLGPINWMRPLRAIAGRHEVLGIEVLDPRDVELPPVGDVILQDTESGVTREFTIDRLADRRSASVSDFESLDSQRMPRSTHNWKICKREQPSAFEVVTDFGRAPLYYDDSTSDGSDHSDLRFRPLSSQEARQLCLTFATTKIATQMTIDIISEGSTGSSCRLTDAEQQTEHTTEARSRKQN